MGMLNHLRESDVAAVIAAAEHCNSATPSSELGVSLEEGLRQYQQARPHREALKQSINSLSLEARQELMALIWFGRGDAIEGDFAQHFAAAKTASDENDVDYIVGKSASLPIYLKAGLDRLKSERPRSKSK
jgi:Protein of unknown function (DUF3775)